MDTTSAMSDVAVVSRKAISIDDDLGITEPGQGSSKSLIDPGEGPSQTEEGDRAKSSSPEPNCAICLGKLENKSFTDSCFHTFCFVCLLEWSKVQAVCPLCKQRFNSIIHNVRSFEDYDQYHLRSEAQAAAELESRRYRFTSTMTNERWWERQRREQERQMALLHRPTRTSVATQWRRQRQPITSGYRRQIYANATRVAEVRTPSGRAMRYREVSPQFYRDNPACTHRLVPWLNRELNVLLANHEDRVQFVLELILDLVSRFGIQSEEFFQHIQPFTGNRTDHFVHEFHSFARSPYDMMAYDQRAVYNEPSEQPVHTIESSEDEATRDSASQSPEIIPVPADDDDDDLIIISSTQPRPLLADEATTSQDHPYSSMFANSNSAQHMLIPQSLRLLPHFDLTPLFDRVHSFLSTIEHVQPPISRWNSPIPGPSAPRSIHADTISEASSPGRLSDVVVTSSRNSDVLSTSSSSRDSDVLSTSSSRRDSDVLSTSSSRRDSDVLSTSSSCHDSDVLSTSSRDSDILSSSSRDSDVQSIPSPEIVVSAHSSDGEEPLRNIETCVEIADETSVGEICADAVGTHLSSSSQNPTNSNLCNQLNNEQSSSDQNKSDQGTSNQNGQGTSGQSVNGQGAGGASNQGNSSSHNPAPASSDDHQDQLTLMPPEQLKQENDSNYEYDDSDSDSSAVIVVGFTKPFDDRSPVPLSEEDPVEAKAAREAAAKAAEDERERIFKIAKLRRDRERARSSSSRSRSRSRSSHRRRSGSRDRYRSSRHDRHDRDAYSSRQSSRSRSQQRSWDRRDTGRDREADRYRRRDVDRGNVRSTSRTRDISERYKERELSTYTALGRYDYPSSRAKDRSSKRRSGSRSKSKCSRSSKGTRSRKVDSSVPKAYQIINSSCSSSRSSSVEVVFRRHHKSKSKHSTKSSARRRNSSIDSPSPPPPRHRARGRASRSPSSTHSRSTRHQQRDVYKKNPSGHKNSSSVRNSDLKEDNREKERRQLEKRARERSERTSDKKSHETSRNRPERTDDKKSNERSRDRSERTDDKKSSEMSRDRVEQTDDKKSKEKSRDSKRNKDQKEASSHSSTMQHRASTENEHSSRRPERLDHHDKTERPSTKRHRTTTISDDEARPQKRSYNMRVEDAVSDADDGHYSGRHERRRRHDESGRRVAGQTVVSNLDSNLSHAELEEIERIAHELTYGSSSNHGHRR